MTAIEDRMHTFVRLEVGEHHESERKACLLEAVAYVAGEDWSDHPACTSSVLGAFGRGLNDVLPDETRQLLHPFIPRLIGAVNDDLDQTRSYMVLDWLIRTWSPAWFDLAHMSDEAARLRSLRRIVDFATAQSAGSVVRETRTKAEAAASAWEAALTAAGDATRDAAESAALDAVGDAARVAARVAAQTAAGDAAVNAAQTVAGYAALDAAQTAAGDAALAAALDAARTVAGYAARVAAQTAAVDAALNAAQTAAEAALAAARDAAESAALDAAGDAARVAASVAARGAAWGVLEPTVTELQMSAIALYGRLITGKWVD